MKHDDGMDDDRFDDSEVGDPRFVDRLRTEAADYNRPPETPREEMWAAIVTNRGSGTGSRGRDAANPGPRRWFALAAAAGLLLATGVGVGLWLAPNVSSTGPFAQSDTMPARDVNPRNAPPPADAASRVPDVAVLDSVRGPSTPDSRLPTSELSYRVAAVRHLSEVETFLTAFQPESSTAKLDAEVGVWARDLLTNTRLLLDSPAAEDALRRRLLEDLELVLVQIVQLTPKAGQKDWDIIERGMRREQVMTRLRTAIPAGQSSGI